MKEKMYKFIELEKEDLDHPPGSRSFDVGDRVKSSKDRAGKSERKKR